jgi:transcription initiation factor TFIIIB Brf1 subunit/transcription initiation factor TFIIB
MRPISVVILLFGFSILGFSGCSNKPKEGEVLVRVNQYEITKQEFEEEFKASSFSRIDTLKSRKEFLDNLITRKLILQEAQRKGLDKDRSFLKVIERFWEQSLLKISLDKKTKEIARSVDVSQKEIEERYKKLVAEGRCDKPYDQMFDFIKWELVRSKGSQQMSEWVAALRKGANVEVNEGLLNK